MLQSYNCINDHFLPLSDWLNCLLQLIFCLLSQYLLVEFEHALSWMACSLLKRLQVDPYHASVFVFSLHPVIEQSGIGFISSDVQFQFVLIGSPVLFKSCFCSLNVLVDLFNFDLTQRTPLHKESLFVSG
jgi:hypothetical protein